MSYVAIRDAVSRVGGISNTSKMPCWSFNLDARGCGVGKILARIAGTICEVCYALGGRYPTPVVRAAQELRRQKLDSPTWVEDMAHIINTRQRRTPKSVGGYFRWFDSGDIVDQKMLDNIIEVCKLTPRVSHWLPTKEYETVAKNKTPIPENLCIRVSAVFVDGKPPQWAQDSDTLKTSTVHNANAAQGKICYAARRNHKCGMCRACWFVDNVSYPMT